MESAIPQNKSLPIDSQSIAPGFKDLGCEDWGLLPYQEALDRQLALVQKVHNENLPGVLVFCQHPPIVTLGRATQAEDIFAWSGDTLEVARGGRATYHGPSQLVIYPILNLNFLRKDRGVHEIHGYLRTLENCICDVLKDYGIQAAGKKGADETGVWVQNKKIASAGIAIKNWVTYHGAAINIFADPEAFKGINPCGFSNSIMTNMEEQLSKKIDLQEIQKKLKSSLLKAL